MDEQIVMKLNTAADYDVSMCIQIILVPTISKGDM